MYSTLVDIRLQSAHISAFVCIAAFAMQRASNTLYADNHFVVSIAVGDRMCLGTQDFDFAQT